MLAAMLAPSTGLIVGTGISIASFPLIGYVASWSPRARSRARPPAG